MENLFFLLIIINIIACSINAIGTDEVIDISDYDYPRRPKEDDEYYKIAIMSSNDIHGAYFPIKDHYPDKEETYEYAGLDYLGKYIEIMRQEWKEDLLYFDAGDQFQGGLETRLSKGVLMTEYYNKIGLSAATFGNHEWDYGMDYLKTRLEASTNFPYVVSNIQDVNTKKRDFLPNQKRSLIIKTSKAKIGVIGLTLNLDPSTTTGDLSQVEFLDYTSTIIEEAKKLREIDHADAVILFAHFSMVCLDEPSILLKLTIRDNKYFQGKCKPNSEIEEILTHIPQGTIDAFIGAHNHEANHHWINNVPIMANINNGKFSSIMYLSFKREGDKLTFQPDKTQMEGPLPICPLIFNNTLRCTQMTKDELSQGHLLPYSFHGVQMNKAESLQALSREWWEKYEKYTLDNVTSIDDAMSPSKQKENPVANLYTNIMLKVSGADFAIINPGVFRIEWTKGNLSVAHIFTMSPYENKYNSFMMKGSDVMRMIDEVERSSRGYYHTNGLALVAKANPKRVIEVKGFNGLREYMIDLEKEYKIVTTDFCIPLGGDDFTEVMKWFKPKEVIDHGDLRDVMIDYLRNVKVIHVKDLMSSVHPRLRILP